LQPTRLEAARNFANKIWNATRFVLSKLGDQGPEYPLGANDQPGTAIHDHSSLVIRHSSDLTLADRWILSRFNRLAADVDRLMRAFNLGEAGRQIQTFFWDDFADWYIETAKVQLDDAAQIAATRAVLRTVLEGTLRLLHPFMPFVTEAAWQHLTHGAADRPNALIVASYPQADAELISDEAERDWELVRDIVRGIRNVRNESGVEAARWIEAIVVGGERTATLQAQSAIISRLARVTTDKLEIVDRIEQTPEQAAALMVGTVEVYLPLTGMVDVAEERARLQKELERAQADVERRRGKLANESFVSRAPAAVVGKERDALAASEAATAKLRERLAAL